MLDVDDKKLNQSWLDEALAGFGADNDSLVMRTRSLLGRIVGDALLHSRLINTLSMLEHIGSYKIMATQHSPRVDQATLKHIAEEAHHAFFMKRQAEKTSGRPMEFVDEDLLAPSAARMYFQRLEAGMLGRLRHQRSENATYLYMSMIVEFRALWFYRLYDQSLKKAGHALSLKRLIGEEQSHLTDIAQRLESAGELSNARAGEFLGIEKMLYERLLGAIQRASLHYS
jgi:hypothetical protein